MNLDSKVVGSSIRMWMALNLLMGIGRLASSHGRSDNEIFRKGRCIEIQ